jgi:hypothetical protein
MNKWRRTFENCHGEGTSKFQCLACKNYFESVDNPVLARQYDGSLSDYGYKFCPNCGIKWDGEHEWGHQDVEYAEWRAIRSSPSIIWAIQEITVWRQKDGSFKQCRYDGEFVEKEWRWDLFGFYVDVSAKDIWERVLAERLTRNNDGSDIVTLVRALAVKPGMPLYDNFKTGNGHCAYSNYRFDYRFWEEYQKHWGGKQHHVNRERRWVIKGRQTTELHAT